MTPPFIFAFNKFGSSAGSSGNAWITDQTTTYKVAPTTNYSVASAPHAPSPNRVASACASGPMFGLFAGGSTASTNTSLVTTVQSLTYATEAWASVTAALTTAKWFASGMGNNVKALVVGGETNGGTRSSTSERWLYSDSTKASSTALSVATGRSASAANATTGLMYSGNTSGTTTVATLHKYDFAAETRTTGANGTYTNERIAGLSDKTNAFFHGGSLSTSWSYSNVSVRYNYTANTWSAGPTLPTPVATAVGTSFASGACYIAGGDAAAAYTGAHTYSFVTNTLTAVASIAKATSHASIFCSKPGWYDS